MNLSPAAGLQVFREFQPNPVVMPAPAAAVCAGADKNSTVHIHRGVIGDTES